MVTTIDRFEETLRAHDCEVSRTTPTGFDETLADVVREPAVGVSLRDPALSLPSTVDDRPTPAGLRDAVTGVTPVAFAVAERGTLAIPATADGAEPVSLYPERHVAVVRAEQVVPDTGAAFERLESTLAADRDSVVMATGPSATGDMGELVRGVHGPSEVHVVVVEGGEAA